MPYPSLVNQVFIHLEEEMMTSDAEKLYMEIRHRGEVIVCLPMISYMTKEKSKARLRRALVFFKNRGQEMIFG